MYTFRNFFCKYLLTELNDRTYSSSGVILFKKNYSFRKRGRGYVKKEEEDEYQDQAGHENGYGQTAPIVIDYAHGHTAVTVKEQPMDVDQPEEEEGTQYLGKMSIKEKAGDKI